MTKYILGEALRLKNGQINQNMLREVNVQILITKVPLSVHKGEVFEYDGHRVGKYMEGGGKVKTSTIAWEVQERECRMALIDKLSFQTSDDKTYYNHERMVQVKRGQAVYDSDCKVAGWSTDIRGLILVDGRKTIKIRSLTTDAVNINSHYQSQLNYLDREIERKIEERYQLSMDPQCKNIQASSVHQTVRLSHNEFSRNMGDVTVMFKCKEVTVTAANVTDRCFKQLRVNQDGRERYMDVNTRILLDRGTETYCSISAVPVVRDKNGVLLAYDPKPRSVKITDMMTIEKSHEGIERGLYPEESVTAWLDHAYIQGYAETVAVMMEDDGDNGVRTWREAAASVRDTYNVVKDFDLKDWIVGRNWEKFGRNCSIVVVIWIAIQGVAKIGQIMAIFAIGYGTDLPTKECVKHALCSECHVYTAVRALNKEENIEMKEI